MMFKLIISMLILTLLFIANGCQCHSSKFNAGSLAKAKSISGSLFELEYFAPRTPYSQLRYRGIIQNHHVLDYYLAATDKSLKYQWSLITPVGNLPVNFPEKPQPLIKLHLDNKDVEYIESLQSKHRSESSASSNDIDLSR